MRALFFIIAYLCPKVKKICLVKSIGLLGGLDDWSIGGESESCDYENYG